MAWNLTLIFPSSQISLSQIHRVGDGNGLYRSLYCNSILQLIAHSSTHFSTIEMQHISMSLIYLTINIQIYSIYNYTNLINLYQNCNYQNKFNSKDSNGPNIKLYIFLYISPWRVGQVHIYYFGVSQDRARISIPRFEICQHSLMCHLR